MRTLIVLLMVAVFSHHATRPEWYRPGFYHAPVTATVMMADGRVK